MDGAIRPAGFWLRALALLVDVVVFGFVQASYAGIATLVFGAGVRQLAAFESSVAFFTLVFAAVYTVALHATAGQTVGKLAVGARVVDLDGAPLTLGTAILRTLGYAASLATFGFGYLMAALRRDKRALHDLIAGTRVERVRVARRRAVPPAEPPPPSTPEAP